MIFYFKLIILTLAAIMYAIIALVLVDNGYREWRLYAIGFVGMVWLIVNLAE